MLFESLDKIRRNSIMSAILLIALGIIVLICPKEYVGFLILILGYILTIISIVMMLNFMSSSKSIMEYLKFTAAIVLGIVGLCVLIFRHDIMNALAWLFGFLLILDGARTLFHSFTYARRSQRQGWWILTILSSLLIIAGLALFINPWWDTPDKLQKVIGGTVLFSSLVSIIRLIWTWPLKRVKGEDNNEQ